MKNVLLLFLVLLSCTTTDLPTTPQSEHLGIIEVSNWYGSDYFGNVAYPDFDVYLSNTKIMTVPYRASYTYSSVPEGTHIVKVLAVDSRFSPPLTIGDSGQVTFAGIGSKVRLKIANDGSTNFVQIVEQ